MTKNKPQKNKIPGGWQEKKLGEFCTFKQGVQVDLDLQVQEKKKGYFKFLRIENYTQKSEDFRYIPKSKVKNSFIDVSDIVVVRYGATAGFISRGLAGVLANNLFTIKPIDTQCIDNDFLYIILKHEKTFFYLQLAMSGGAMPALSFAMLKPMKFIIPPLPEQKRIVAVLEVWDEMIEKLERKIEVKKNIKKGLMQQLLTAKKRLPGFDGEREEKKLGDVVDFWNGKGHEKGISENGKYIVVNSKFISSDGVVKKFSDEQKSPLEKGDVVMVMSDVPNGKAIAKTFLIEKDGKYTLNQRIGGFSSKKIISEFLARLINRNKYFLSFDDGVSQTNLRKDDILACKLVFPNLKEQKAIAEILTTADEEIEKLGEKLGKVKDQKKFLLNNLVTGGNSCTKIINS